MTQNIKVGDKVTYCRCTGYREPDCKVIKVNGELITIETECFDGKATVHSGNTSTTSRDWIERN
jgi:hypothetical protein